MTVDIVSEFTYNSEQESRENQEYNDYDIVSTSEKKGKKNTIT